MFTRPLFRRFQKKILVDKKNNWHLLSHQTLKTLKFGQNSDGMQTFLKKKTKCLIVILRMTNCIVDFFYDADNLGINFFSFKKYNALCYMGLRILGVVLVLFKYLWSKTLKKTTAKSDIYHSPIYPFLYMPTNSNKMSKYITHRARNGF